MNPIEVLHALAVAVGVPQSLCDDLRLRIDEAAAADKDLQWEENIARGKPPSLTSKIATAREDHAAAIARLEETRQRLVRAYAVHLRDLADGG